MKKIKLVLLFVGLIASFAIGSLAFANKVTPMDSGTKKLMSNGKIFCCCPGSLTCGSADCSSSVCKPNPE